jgi:hypothetical protein
MSVFETLGQLFETKKQKRKKGAQQAEERKLVLGRLAASNIASHADTQTAARLKDDIIAANERVEAFKFTDPALQTFRADLVVEAIVWMLQNAELTIQIDPAALFALDPKILGDRVKSAWDLANLKGAAYLAKREGTEATLFDYANSPAPYAKSMGNANLQQGTTNNQNASFATSSRPLYAAVNFGRFSVYAAGMNYGDCLLKLRSHVALNCTFTEQDSFRVTSIDKLGSYHNLYPIIKNCNPTMLNALAEVACLDKSLQNSPGYIEAQLHCPIMFKRDVEGVRIWTTKYDGLSAGAKKNLSTFLTSHSLAGRFTKHDDPRSTMPRTGKKPIEVYAITG